MQRDDLSDQKSNAFKTLEERQEKRHRRASLGKLIYYIIALIVVLVLMLWLRAKGI